MPDHFHVLLTPSSETTLERSVQYIKGGSAHLIRTELQSKWPVWQRGFSDHRIRERADYEGHVRYLEENPIKERLVVTAADYEWSSACGKYVLDDCPQGLKPQKQKERVGTVRHG